MLGLSLLPCCRYHPAGMIQPYHPVFVCPSCLRPPVAGSASGSSHFRGHLCVHSRYGLVIRSHPFDGCVDRLQDFGFPPPCYPSYRALALTLAGLPPAEQTSLRWTHNRTGTSRLIRLPLSKHQGIPRFPVYKCIWHFPCDQMQLLTRLCLAPTQCLVLSHHPANQIAIEMRPDRRHG